MSFITAIIACLTGGCNPATVNIYRPLATSTEVDTTLRYQPMTNPKDEQDMASQIVEILRAAEKSSEAINRLQSVVRTQGWTEHLARAVLNGVIQILSESREKIGPAMAEAVRVAENAADDLFKFAKANPEAVAGFLIIVAVGTIGYMMAPWILEALGFAELGSIEGSFAAWWESMYAGYIPRGSWFSFFQRLGMTWSKATLVARL